MKDNETIGLVTIIVGLVLVIGAVRGTWKKIFQDVILAQPSSTTSATTTTGATMGLTQPGMTIAPEAIPIAPMTNGAIPSQTTVLI